MTEQRATRWVIALAAACALYFVSVMVTGAWTRNGAWLIVVLVVIAGASDAVASAFRARR